VTRRFEVVASSIATSPGQVDRIPPKRRQGGRVTLAEKVPKCGDDRPLSRAVQMLAEE
jgi:hypothetical protein